MFGLAAVESVTPTGRYENMVDIEVEEDSSFVLASGLVSHNSAKGGFRKYRDPQTQAAFPIRGKFKNVTRLKTPADIMKNEEAKNLMAAIGLKIGERAEKLRYSKILIYTDQDHDGSDITGQLINFFVRNWPELLTEGRLWKVSTPLRVAKKGKELRYFYSEDEHAVWAASAEAKRGGWEVTYKKGLAALNDDEYEEIVRRPVAFKFEADENYADTLSVWFDDKAKPRKDKIYERMAATDEPLDEPLDEPKE